MSDIIEKYPIILSFDVGVIHLSYCLLTKKKFDDNKINWDIIEWNNIDLTNRNNQICHCGLKASYTNIINNEINYYCKNHSKNLNLNIRSFEDCFNKCNTDMNCCHNINSKNNIKSCDKIGKYYLSDNNDKKYCTTHAKNYYKNINKLLDLKDYKIKKSTTINFDTIKYNLIMELENRPNLLLANYVVIENQPAFKNPRMKSIASTLYDYYLIRGIIDKNKGSLLQSNISQVRFISPSNKLKLANDDDSNELIKIKKTDNDSKTYKLTKNLGIKYCINMIQHSNKWCAHFEKHKKKDDLADSFLQGAYFYNTIKN